MGITSTIKSEESGSKCPSFQKQIGTNQKYEKLRVVGYGILGVIASLAILFFCTALSFAGAGLFYAKLYGTGGDLAKALVWYSSTFWTSLIIGPLISIYPIKKIAGPFFSR